jgi:hypothetical protein
MLFVEPLSTGHSPFTGDECSTDLGLVAQQMKEAIFLFSLH